MGPIRVLLEFENGAKEFRHRFVRWGRSGGIVVRMCANRDAAIRPRKWFTRFDIDHKAHRLFANGAPVAHLGLREKHAGLELRIVKGAKRVRIFGQSHVASGLTKPLRIASAGRDGNTRLFAGINFRALTAL
jgi:hypothetical protein